MKAIVRSTENFQVRILRPSEWEILREAMDTDTRKISTSLLVTGMRYAELQRLRENPDWPDGKFIYLLSPVNHLVGVINAHFAPVNLF